MATITLDLERLTYELSRRGMPMADLLRGPDRVSTNVLAKIRKGQPIRQDSAHKIAAALETRGVRPSMASILPVTAQEAV